MSPQNPGSTNPIYREHCVSELIQGNPEPLSALLEDHFGAKEFIQKLRVGKLQVDVHHRGSHLQVMLRADRVPNPDVATAIAYFGLRDLPFRQSQRVKVLGLRQTGKTAAVAWSREFTIVPLDRTDRNNPMSFNNPTVNAVALPCMSLVAMGLNNSPLLILLRPFQIWIHEFGHATVAWLGGRQAIPLPIGWTSWNPERSAFVYFGILFLLGLLFHSGVKERLRWPMVLAVSLALIQFCVTWLVSQDWLEMAITFSGGGGELYLSTLLMVSFYFPMPDRWQWDFLRYPCLFAATSTFWNSFWLWRRIQQGEAEIPWGTLLFGQGDAGGDMNRLVDDYGWTDVGIIATYNHLGNWCLLILVVVYLTFIIVPNPQRWVDWKYKLALSSTGR